MAPSRLLGFSALAFLIPGTVLAATTIETVAGNGMCCFNGDGMHALSTSFNTPVNLYIDADGNIYIADFYNDRVRRIDSITRIAATVAGNGVRTGSIDGPGGVPHDDLGDGGAATSASLNLVAAISRATDGTLFVGDRENRRLRVVDPLTGIITTLAGTGAAGAPLSGVPGTQSDVYPVDLIVDALGDPFVLDDFGRRVARVDLSTGFIFDVSDAGLASVPGGTRGFTQDSAGFLYFADSFNHEVRRVDPATGASFRIAGITRQFGYSGDGGPAIEARLSGPTDITLAADRYLFVADQFNHRVRMIDLVTGLIDTAAGNGRGTHTIDGEGGDPADDLGDGGPADQATFDLPFAVAVSPRGDLYVGDSGNYRVRRVSGFCLPGYSRDPTLALTPRILWPPNHEMVEIEADITGCTGTGVVKLAGVTSSEPDDEPGGGDGQTTGDIQGADIGNPDLRFQVRAERAASGMGRTYVVTYETEDEGGLPVFLNASILVPRNLHSVKPLARVASRETPGGTLLEWEPVPFARSYSVVRGRLGELRRTGSSLDLGSLDCVAAATTRTDLLGLEDGLVPEPGQGFFYLVGYEDPWTDSDGTERLALHPVRYSGGCP